MTELERKFINEIEAENEYYNDRCDRIRETASETQGISFTLENAYNEHYEALQEIEQEIIDSGIKSEVLMKSLWQN